MVKTDMGVVMLVFYPSITELMFLYASLFQVRMFSNKDSVNFKHAKFKVREVLVPIDSKTLLIPKVSKLGNCVFGP